MVSLDRFLNYQWVFEMCMCVCVLGAGKGITPFCQELTESPFFKMHQQKGRCSTSLSCSTYLEISGSKSHHILGLSQL